MRDSDFRLSFQKTSFLAAQAAERPAGQVQRDVFESQRHHVYALAFYMTGNELEAEEILTNSFIQAFQQSDRPDPFAIDTILVSEIGKRFSLAPEQSEDSLQNTDPKGANLNNEDASLGGRNVRRADLEAAVLCLPAHERLLFLLRDVEGYSLEAISKLLNIPQTDVRHSLLSARIHLCRSLAAIVPSNSEAA